jgi:tRNA G26 N,N-dimethylase Trm1
MAGAIKLAWKPAPGRLIFECSKCRTQHIIKTGAHQTAKCPCGIVYRFYDPLFLGALKLSPVRAIKKRKSRAG